MLDVIVPCYNEVDVIEKFFEVASNDLLNIKHNFIFVNDGSTDKTLDKLKYIYNNNKECVKIISFSKNYGKEAALKAGLSASNGKYTCIIDADLQQNPKYLVKMYELLEKSDEYDVIAMCQKQDKNRFIQKKFYSVMNKLSNIHVESGASDFRMFRKNVRDAILSMDEKCRFSKGLFSYVGFNTYYASYKVEPRRGGNTKWSFKSLLNYAFDGIIAFSSKPIRFVSLLGSLDLLISLIYLIVKLILNIKDYKYTLIMFTLLFVGGLIILSLGIIGEYISKIYEEVKCRPNYIIKERFGFDESLL